MLVLPAKNQIILCIIVSIARKNGGFFINQYSSSPLFLSRSNRFHTQMKRKFIYFSNNPEMYVFNNDDDEEDEEEDDEEDQYKSFAASEFEEGDENNASSLASNMDWGSELSSLRQRISDVETGKSKDPSQALFRIMTSNSPSESIAKFVQDANPEVVQSMSGTVSSLLGGLSNPLNGMETLVKASSERLGALCFQLQMTGYMFRNAEYVVALKQLMRIRNSASLTEYKEAFESLDKDQSGYIEISEVDTLLSNVYEGKAPKFEVDAFMNYFDTNSDGRISWKEFEKGLGIMKAKNVTAQSTEALSLTGSQEDLPNDEEEYPGLLDTPSISGTIEVEIGNGKYIQVEAKDYVQDLKKEMQELKDALLNEKGISQPPTSALSSNDIMDPDSSPTAGITSYISSLGSEVSTLTEGISPEVVDAMKLLVDYVLDDKNTNKRSPERNRHSGPKELEIPGSALQQLALWQLVVGYRLREAEATGEYRRMME